MKHRGVQDPLEIVLAIAFLAFMATFTILILTA